MVETLNNNIGSITFEENQKNSITFYTANTFVDSNIQVTTLVTKAILNNTDPDRQSFTIQIPNGDSPTPVTLNFEVQPNGNVVVT